jgi:hypothetical protein
MDEPLKPKWLRVWSRQAPITIIGVVLLGLLGSGLYDLLVKPGMTTFSRLFLDVITLGSEMLRDSAYSSAALDPRPVGGLLLLQGAMVLLGGFTAGVFTKVFRTKPPPLGDLITETDEDAAKKAADDAAKVKRLRLGKLYAWRVGTAALTMSMVFVALAASSVHSQSVLIWRVFHANLRILTPLTPQLELQKLESSFASMKTSKDYSAIRLRLRTLAAERGATLLEYETW